MAARGARGSAGGPTVRRVKKEDWDEWLRLRRALWPEGTAEEHTREMAWYTTSGRGATFVIERPQGGLGGFVEVSIRPFADGCRTRPVGYLEGWYVDPDLRRQGLGTKLVRAAEAWALAQGCREMGSDTQIDNAVSLRAHLALGFQEVERAIHFCKPLLPPRAREKE